MPKPKERIIYDNYDIDVYREEAIENLNINNIENPTEEQILNEEYEISNEDWELEKVNLEKEFNSGDFLAIGTCGRWDGNRAGGFVFSNFNELMSYLKDCDYFKFWDENGHFFVKATHHDGTHHLEIKRLTEKGKTRYDNYWNYGWGKETERELHQKLWKDSHYTKLINYAAKYFGCPKKRKGENSMNKSFCNDSRKCFARDEFRKCKILNETYENNGDCKFCKATCSITKGKSYPYDMLEYYERMSKQVNKVRHKKKAN